MIFERLIIENFLSIKEASVELNGRGLLLIQGVNRENGGASSNGAGKSSVVDAVFWTLYGKTARGIGTDEVVNDTVGKDCRVSLLLKDGDDEYLITRHRKHAKGKNRLVVFMNGKEITSGTDKQTQEQVNKIIGSTESVFANSVYAGQEAMPDLPNRTDKELKSLVEEAAGIDRLNLAYQAQLKKASTLKTEVIASEAQLDKLNDRLVNAENQLTRYRDADNQWGIDRGIKAKKMRGEIEGWKAAFEKLEVASVLARKKDLEAQAEAIKAKIAATDAEREKLTTLEREATAADTAVKLEQSKVTSAGELVKKRKAELENVEKLVGTPCSECGKDYAEHDLDDVRKLRKQSLIDAVASYKALRTSLGDVENRSTIAQETLTDFRASMTNVSDEIDAERKIRSSLFDIQGDITSATNLKSQVTNGVKTLKALIAESSPYVKMIADEEVALEGHKQAIVDHQEALDALRHRHLVSMKAAEVLSTSGVRAHILDHVTPLLNDRTSHYLGQLSEGEIGATWQTINATKAGELREKFAINVTNTKGSQSFGGLSGGEKRKVRIATAMALQDLVSTRSSKALPLFIFDEIDHALDGDGLERLMSIIKEKASSTSTVLVISHNDLNHYITDTLTVIKEDGFSRVEA